MKLAGKLFDGPLDIVGDVHGEIDALHRLLAHLGYDAEGRHSERRRLVFLGDLTDRGPDSPAVLETVIALVHAGRTQCIVGNHELNLLRDVVKDGNDWWSRPQVPAPLPARPVTPEQKERFAAFLHALPLALERPDVQVVHACWNCESIAARAGRWRAGAGTGGAARLSVPGAGIELQSMSLCTTPACMIARRNRSGCCSEPPPGNPGRFRHRRWQLHQRRRRGPVLRRGGRGRASRIFINNAFVTGGGSGSRPITCRTAIRRSAACSRRPSRAALCCSAPGSSRREGGTVRSHGPERAVPSAESPACGPGPERFPARTRGPLRCVRPGADL